MFIVYLQKERANTMEERINTVTSLLQPAGKIFLKYLSKNTSEVWEKTKNDFVTKADKDIESYLTQKILRSFPTDSVMQEEHKDIHGESEYTWIIDPIDGTNNYVRKIHDARIMVALMKRKEIVFGAIYNPFLQELYMARKNKGAKIIRFEDKKRVALRVSSKALIESLVIYTAGIASGERQGKKIFNKLLGKVGAIRIYGSAAVAFELIASGKADSFICHIAKPMDMAAGALLVQEAGGTVTNFEGKDWQLHMKDILVTNGLNTKDFLLICNK